MTRIDTYHEFFENIHNKTLRIVKRYVDDGLWRVDQDEGFVMMSDMVDEIADVYDIPHPNGPVESDYEWYRPPTQTIGLPKVSLVSCLHEFRHHMQYNGRQSYDDKERDARGWSVSTFKLALPEKFESAWRRGLIWFLPEYEEENVI